MGQHINYLTHSLTLEISIPGASPTRSPPHQHHTHHRRTIFLSIRRTPRCKRYHTHQHRMPLGRLRALPHPRQSTRAATARASKVDAWTVSPTPSTHLNQRFSDSGMEQAYSPVAGKYLFKSEQHEEYLARVDHERQCKQDRRWLHAQMQRGRFSKVKPPS